MRTSLHLRPVRSLSILAATAAFALAASSCGTTADTTAATVGDRTISIDDVNEIIDEPAIVGTGAEAVTESRQPGDLARSALMYEIQRLAWVEEAERWGIDLDEEDRTEAEAQLDAQLLQAGVELSPSAREGAVDSSVAQNALLVRWAEIDPSSDEDLRLVYEGAPSRWRTWCLTVVAVGPEDEDRVESLLDDGVALGDVAERVELAELVATPDECFAGSELPPELETAAREAGERGARGARPAPVPTNLGGGEGLLFFEVHRATAPSFEESRDVVAQVAAGLANAVEQLASLSAIGADATDAELQQAQQVQQEAVGVLTGWVEERMRSAVVNPRYGSGVVGGGSSVDATLRIAPPAAPLQPAGELLSSLEGLELDPTAGG